MDKITIDKKDLTRVMCQKQFGYTVQENLAIDAEEYFKRDIANGLAREMLENDLIDFEETITPDGFKRFRGQVIVYKEKSEE